MPVIPITQQAEHRVKEQALKHKSPLAGADDFTLPVESGPEAKEIMDELLDVCGLMAAAVSLPPRLLKQRSMRWSQNSCHEQRCLHL